MSKIVFAKKAGDLTTIDVPSSVGSVKMTITMAPRAEARRLNAMLQRAHAEDLPRRSNPDEVSPDGMETLAQICGDGPLDASGKPAIGPDGKRSAGIAARLIRKIENVEIGGVDLETLPPEPWECAGETYHGLGRAAIALLDQATLLIPLALRALSEQSPSVTQREPCEPRRPQKPETFPADRTPSSTATCTDATLTPIYAAPTGAGQAPQPGS